MFLLCGWLVPPAAAEGGTVATPVIEATGAVQIGTTGTYAIPPAGITVTVTCATADADIYYTLDGSDPTEANTRYTVAVAIPEQQNLTAQKTVTFKAKAFKGGYTASATATAAFTNYAIPEFSMKLGVAGNQWGPNTLEFGMKTGATDGLDAFDASEGEPPPASPPGVPPPPMPAVVFTTDLELPVGGGQLLDVDYRSRTVTKRWRMQVQLVNTLQPNSAQITLTWGAGAGFPLPSVPSLKLVRETESGVFAQVANLTQDGSLVISTTTFPTLGVEDDLYYRVFYVEYDARGSLQVNLGPQGLPADARWQYRELGGAYTAWQESGVTTASIPPGTYEVQLNQLPVESGFYRPPNQLVTVVGGSAPTVLNAVYLTAPSQATMTVSPTFDPETKTVEVECSYTYTPDVNLTVIVWTFDLPAGWSIEEITGLPAGWSSDIDVVTNPDGTTTNTVTFTAPAGRSTPSGNFFGFGMELQYTGEEPGPLVVSVTSIVGSGGGDPVNTDPPEDVTSNPRTATLDVDGDVDVDGNDALFLYRKIVIYDFNQTYFGAGSLADVVPNPALLPLGVTAQDVLDTITALGADLDVDDDGDVDGNDALFIYRKIVVYNFNETYFGAGSLTDIVPNPGLLPVGVTAEQVKNNIEALEP
jgi:hypothetical protein